MNYRSVRISLVAFVATVALVLFNSAFALSAEHAEYAGTVVTPPSSIEHPGDVGSFAHTNFRLFVPARGFNKPQGSGPPFSGYFFETPASLACVYSLVTPAVAGCNPNSVTANPTGGSKAIAVVDAYGYPRAASDLAVFSAQFGLPAANLQVVHANGYRPRNDLGWELEQALDIQMVHAMAPSAKIYLVEARSASFYDLLNAVHVANNLVAAAGGGEVTMGWGSSEFASETSYDNFFTTPGIVYFAAAGDGVSPLWPAASPNVVAAGGTTLRRDPSSGNLIAETAWEEGGSGKSAYEIIPGYQGAIAGIVGSARGLPDLSAVADPNTGVWVYDSGNGGWNIVGGTSVAAQVLGGIVNRAGQFAASTNQELTTIYSNIGNTDFNDTVSGFCGPYCGYSTVAGWDFCTGVGSPKGYLGK